MHSALRLVRFFMDSGVSDTSLRIYEALAGSGGHQPEGIIIIYHIDYYTIITLRLCDYCLNLM